VELLVAAHIKRRSECTDREKRDYGNNVVPMCLFGCDALFERGFIIVRNGRVRRGRPMAHQASTVFEGVVGKRVASWNAETRKYFKWHARQHAV
jgi:hypothetical protein